MSVEHLMGDPVSVRVKKRVEENRESVSLYFDLPHLYTSLTPGEFLMVWVLGVDEIPMSISSWSLSTAGITVRPVGAATKALATLQEKEWFGIRGPFGRGFTLNSRRALVVGGGIGMPPLRFLTDELLAQDAKVTLILAAKTREELILYDFYERNNPSLEVCITTDDGSRGSKGLATTIAEEVLRTKEFDTIYTCGPELMMVGLTKLAKEHGIQIQASLERYMKCGCGICGTCAMDPVGALVCRDGPVFTGDELEKISEFGKYHRDATGVKKKF